MPEQITTAAELDSLPIGSVVMTETHRGFGGGYEQRVWMRHGGQGSPLIHDWQSTDGGFQRVGEPEHARGMWAVNRNVTVLYRPDAPSLGADDQAGGPLEGAPKPSAEAVADALIRYETGGCCGFGTTCGLCDCGRSDQTAEQRREWDEHQLDRARAVMALIPPQRCAPRPNIRKGSIMNGELPELHDPNRITGRSLDQKLADWESLAKRGQVHDGNQAVLDLVGQVREHLRLDAIESLSEGR